MKTYRAEKIRRNRLRFSNRKLLMFVFSSEPKQVRSIAVFYHKRETWKHID
jgi:hypothetical protein